MIATVFLFITEPPYSHSTQITFFVTIINTGMLTTLLKRPWETRESPITTSYENNKKTFHFFLVGPSIFTTGLFLAIFIAGQFGDKTVNLIDYVSAFIGGSILIYSSCTALFIYNYEKLSSRRIKLLEIAILLFASLTVATTVFSSFPNLEPKAIKGLLTASLLFAVITLPVQLAKLTYEFYSD